MHASAYVLSHLANGVLALTRQGVAVCTSNAASALAIEWSAEQFGVRC